VFDLEATRPQGFGHRIGQLIGGDEHGSVSRGQPEFTETFGEAAGERIWPGIPARQQDEKGVRTARTLAMRHCRRFAAGVIQRERGSVGLGCGRDLRWTAMTSRELDGYQSRELGAQEVPPDCPRIDRLTGISKQEQRLGMTAQFMEEAQRSQREIVHLIHDDDVVARHRGVLPNRFPGELTPFFAEEEALLTQQVAEGLIDAPDRLTLVGIERKLATSAIGRAVFLECAETATENDLFDLLLDV
jgi:hypothetical protein